MHGGEGDKASSFIEHTASMTLPVILTPWFVVWPGLPVQLLSTFTTLPNEGVREIRP